MRNFTQLKELQVKYNLTDEQIDNVLDTYLSEIDGFNKNRYDVFPPFQEYTDWVMKQLELKYPEMEQDYNDLSDTNYEFEYDFRTIIWYLYKIDTLNLVEELEESYLENLIENDKIEN